MSEEDPDDFGSSAICWDGEVRKACSSLQMKILQRWIEKEGFELDKAQSFPHLPSRSPLYYLETMPTTKTSLTASHEYNKEGCGLAALVAKLGKDGKTRLLRWAMEKGDEARPVMDEHTKYIAEQQKTLSWFTYTKYTI